jgi:hypothetical protein
MAWLSKKLPIETVRPAGSAPIPTSFAVAA